MDKTLMVVDDDKMILETLDRVLSRGGYEARCARGAEEALKILDAADIKVFLIDLKMPLTDGVSLCKQIKKRKPMACVYAMTGHMTEYHVETCRAAGFDDYFIKPFDVDLILNAAKSGFEKVERWQQHGEEAGKDS